MNNPTGAKPSPNSDILLHSCCGPCSIGILEKLKADAVTVTSYFYNPNIHPWQEFSARRESWRKLMELTATKHLEDHSYPLDEWLGAVAANPTARCSHCYETRLWQTAKTARALSIPAFSTTLLISPYQNHEEIIRAGRRVADAEGVVFYEEDFRPLFRQGQELARELGLYMQKYCGCIYSERDRYYKDRGGSTR